MLTLANMRPISGFTPSIYLTDLRPQKFDALGNPLLSLRCGVAGRNSEHGHSFVLNVSELSIYGLKHRANMNNR